MDDPLRPHSHEPNPEPPSAAPSFKLQIPAANLRWILTPPDLDVLPQTAVPSCYIVSTGHGTSGPYAFRGVTLARLIAAHYPNPWHNAEIIGADGFGSRVFAAELLDPANKRPILLATHIDGRALTRAEGLVRLIVPSEVHDALRQVKWIAEVTVNIV